MTGRPKSARFEVDVTLDRLETAGGNDPERLEAFRDQAFGMFIHWSCDSPLGLEISHPMIGASETVLRQYEEELGPRFNPRRFDAEDYAALAEDAGMRYCCFTAKHHNGYCMFDTATTDFGVTRSRFGRDVFRETADCLRRRGLGVGVYFSPYDFHWLRRNGIPLRFADPTVLPVNNPGLLAYDREQVRELMTRYGPIDTFFFDGPPEGLKELVWAIDPRTVVTRGELPTPEQTLPDAPVAGAWETCHTLGGQWGWNGEMLLDKTAGELIELLVKTRARGGNLLLNVTPNPDGTIPTEQERVLREVGLWLFWHRPAIYAARPYRVEREPDQPILYTQSKDGRAVYAFLMDGVSYDRGERRQFLLKAVRAGPDTRVELLGQNGRILEHAPPDADVRTRFEQRPEGLWIDAMRCLRPSGQREYPHPFVLEIINPAS